MNLKGGVIIVGSLLWDNAERAEWRSRSLKSLETKVPVALRIRYGRESGEQRRHTYTMILSNHPTTLFGQGYIVELKNRIKSEESLKDAAIALARAEGLCADQSLWLAKEWGAVGLLVNGNRRNANTITEMWSRLFRLHRSEQPRTRYEHARYRIDDESTVIDDQGFLQIDWQPEMDTFDFLLATPTVPRPKRTLTALEIAQRMTEQNYRTYFDNNRVAGIQTFQDDDILGYLPIHPEAR